jgi:hypothetical protein
MRNAKLIHLRKEENYGIITDISKDLNSAFGDKSGRTVSRRTAQGLKKSLDIQHIDDDSAEHIVHAGMALSTILLKSKDETSNGIGILLFAGLLGCYLKGK